jgi:hypothetical protein
MRCHAPLSWPILATSAALGMLTLAGCGDSDELPREPVSGTVTLDGKPLASGLITFQPEGTDIATQGGGPIESGEYAIPRDQGLVPGKYTVSITSGGGSETIVDDTNNMPGMPPVPSQETIPARYNTESELTAEVTAGGANRFPFELKTKPK